MENINTKHTNFGKSPPIVSSSEWKWREKYKNEENKREKSINKKIIYYRMKSAISHKKKIKQITMKSQI